MKKRFIAYLLFIIFSISFSVANPPHKCCHKVDTLNTEPTKMDPSKCNKEESKKETKNFTMMSLNLVYYLMNKYINTSFEHE